MRLRVESTDQDKRLWTRLHGAGLHLTNNRRTILAVFFAGTETVTISDLWLRTKKTDPKASYSAVWRLLNALVRCGLAQRAISAADGIPRYGPVKMECSHENVACMDCGATISTEGGQHDPVDQVGKE